MEHNQTDQEIPKKRYCGTRFIAIPLFNEAGEAHVSTGFWA